jgi:regulator of cell morphogenesis and NO signaling
VSVGKANADRFINIYSDLEVTLNATQTTVRELVVEFPNATRLFERLGIDYCCGGHRSLQDACLEAGVSVEDITDSAELKKAADEVTDQPNFVTAPLKQLVTHVVQKHHVFTKNEIQRLRGLIDKVLGVHGANHPELFHLRTHFQTLSSELEPHMLKEECVLFPYIMRLEEAVEHHHMMSTPPFRTVANPVRMMTVEHEGAGYLLKQMRHLTSDYTPPADACISYQTLYQALDAFEKDLHQHIHLENNILFPRAEEMEVGLLS